MTYLAKIEQLNSADLSAYRPLILDGDPVGLIWRDNLARLRDHGLDLRDDGDSLVWHAPADFTARNAILARLAQALAAEGYVRGWRDEQLPLLANLQRPVRALIERAAGDWRLRLRRPFERHDDARRRTAYVDCAPRRDEKR